MTWTSMPPPNRSVDVWRFAEVIQGGSPVRTWQPILLAISGHWQPGVGGDTMEADREEYAAVARFWTRQPGVRAGDEIRYGAERWEVRDATDLAGEGAVFRLRLRKRQEV